MRYAKLAGAVQGGSAVVWLLVVAALGAAGYYLAPAFEWHAPQVRLGLAGDRLGLAPFEVAVTEEGRGLKRLNVSLTVGNDEIVLHDEQFAQPAFEKSVQIDPASFRDRVREGPARLRITATDSSNWGWFRGNRGVVERQVTVDLTPPRVEVLSR